MAKDFGCFSNAQITCVFILFPMFVGVIQRCYCATRCSLQMGGLKSVRDPFSFQQLNKNGGLT